MFQILFVRNSSFHLRTHSNRISKNFWICTGFAPIARAAEIFCEFFLCRFGFLCKYPDSHLHPATFLVGKNPFSWFCWLIHMQAGITCHLKRGSLSSHNTSPAPQVHLLGLIKMWEIKHCRDLEVSTKQLGHQSR